MAAKKKAPEGEPKEKTVYDVIERISGVVEGTHKTRATAKKEAERLNGEAFRGEFRHMGVPKEYEVVSRSGVILG